MKRARNVLGLALSALLSLNCAGGGNKDPGTVGPPSNLPPHVAPDSASVLMNTAVDIDVLANDADPEGDPLSVSAVTAGSGGAVSINPDSSVHYVPLLNFTGQDTFTYTLTDGQGHFVQGIVTVMVSYPGGSPIERVSVSTSGVEGNQSSWMGAISGGGRYVAFLTAATTLVSGAPSYSILVHDRLTNGTTLVSCDSSGVPGGGSSQQPAISADGRYIAFTSSSDKLVAGDTNGTADIFLRDQVAGTTVRISVDSSGGQANGTSFAPSISADGRYIAYFSIASNLVPVDANGTAGDIFVFDRENGQTVLASIGPSGLQIGGGAFDDGPSISADGRYVAFSSGGQIYVRDLTLQTTVLASVTSTGSVGNDVSDAPVISANGRYVAFSSLSTNLVTGDTNGFKDVFVRDLEAGVTIRASVGTGGLEGSGPVPDLIHSAISPDGRYVAFLSEATNLVASDANGVADVFVHDVKTGQTARVSVSAALAEANGASGDGVMLSISADGKYVSFSSAATNLVSGDGNGWIDVFVAPNPLAP